MNFEFIIPLVIFGIILISIVFIAIHSEQKTKISDETISFLKDFVHQINTQDSRGTRSPYYYVVMTYEEIAVPNGCGRGMRYIWEGCSYTEQEFRAVIIESGFWDDEAKAKFDDDFDRFFNDFVESDDVNSFEWDYVEKIENVFFTKKGYDAHMKQNKHNYSKLNNGPHSYIKYACRNPEIEGLMKAIRDVVEYY